MIWIDEDDWLRDLPALILAVMLHAALLGNGPLSWGKNDQLKPGLKAVAVEVVASLPKPPAPPPAVTVAIKPVPQAPKEGDAAPKKGAGPVEPEKHAKPKQPKFAAKRAQAGAKPPLALKKKPVLNRMTPDQLRLLAERRAQRKLKAQAISRQRLQAKMVREEQLRQARRRALELSLRKEEEAKAKAEAAAAALAEKRREDAERRAELARKRAEAAQRAAEARAEKARQRAELKSALATMKDPDEALSDAVAEPETGSVGAAGSPRGRGTQEALVPTGDRGDVAQMAEGAEPVYEMEREGFDPISAEGKGGGEGPDGGGIGWSIDGPAGNRSIVKRVLPESPAWVAQRGLDLSVQIKFQIDAMGHVKAGAVIKRTSGFPDIDRRALEAIKKWRFEPLHGRPDAADAWGNVTFKFVMG